MLVVDRGIGVVVFACFLLFVLEVWCSCKALDLKKALL